MLGGKTGAPASLHICGKLVHRFLCDNASFATGKRSFRPINCGKDFRASALTLLPQGKAFLYRVFLAQKTSALYSLADERSLVQAFARVDCRTMPGKLGAGRQPGVN